MPIYLYEIVTDDPDHRRTFEVVQDVNEAPLTVDPESGLPVRRLISAPAVVGTTRSSSQRNVLSDRNIASKGFTRYERTGDGTYARTAGTHGPKTIRRP